MKIVLNAIIAKPAAMGGYNVAKNFYFRTLLDNENDWYYFVSEDFDKDIKGLENGLDKKHYFVFHTQPDFKHFFSDRQKIRHAEESIQPDVVYSILAPSYHKFKAVEVMRCANAWSVVGGVNKYALKVTPFKYRLRYLLKAWITHFQMRNTKYFVTQTEIAKKCILQTVRTSPEFIKVVPNVLSKKYQKFNSEKIPHKGFNMVYISSPATHKDFLLLPRVVYYLIKQFALKDFKIHVTIPDYCSSLFVQRIEKYGLKAYFVNHGFLKTDELVNVYRQSDLALFPSLLETFSATLLEYMYFRLPIVASDLNFNKEVTENAALYFEPHNAEDMAQKIYQVYSNKALAQDLIDNAVKRLVLFDYNVDSYSETICFLNVVARKKVGCRNVLFNTNIVKSI